MKRFIIALAICTLSVNVIAAGKATKKSTEKAPAKASSTVAPASQNMERSEASTSARSGGYKKAKGKFSRPFGVAGCGLGSAVMGKSGSQIFAATTNGTFSSQMLGISFGTSNCTDSAENEVAFKADYFIKANRVALENDIARGSGETLVGLSRVLGCQNNNFGTLMKQNFGEIFNSENSAPNEITDAIISVIQNDEALSTQCHLS